MDFLKSFFGKLCVVEKTHRVFMNRVKLINEPNDDMLIYLFLTNILLFSNRKKIINGKITKTISSKYRNDFAFFEVFCYLYFYVDKYIFFKYPNIRKELAIPLRNNCVEMFMEAFPHFDIPKSFNNRVNVYGKMHRDGNSDQEISNLFTALVFNTVHNKQIDPDVEKASVPVLDLQHYLSLSLNVAAYYKFYVSAIFESIDIFVRAKHGNTQ